VRLASTHLRPKPRPEVVVPHHLAAVVVVVVVVLRRLAAAAVPHHLAAVVVVVVVVPRRLAAAAVVLRRRPLQLEKPPIRLLPPSLGHLVAVAVGPNRLEQIPAVLQEAVLSHPSAAEVQRFRAVGHHPQQHLARARLVVARAASAHRRTNRVVAVVVAVDCSLALGTRHHLHRPLAVGRVPLAQVGRPSLALGLEGGLPVLELTAKLKVRQMLRVHRRALVPAHQVLVHGQALGSSPSPAHPLADLAVPRRALAQAVAAVAAVAAASAAAAGRVPAPQRALASQEAGLPRRLHRSMQVAGARQALDRAAAVSPAVGLERRRALALVEERPSTRAAATNSAAWSRGEQNPSNAVLGLHNTHHALLSYAIEYTIHSLYAYLYTHSVDCSCSLRATNDARARTSTVPFTYQRGGEECKSGGKCNTLLSA
jgi:hypothetical protein